MLILAAATVAIDTSAFGQGTAFTYQGALTAGGSPANGSFDMTFELFDSVANGNYVSSTTTNTSTAVSNGLFNVVLDFGGGIFTGASYWLEIGVRTNGSNAFTILVPRQELTPSPYAIYAPTAGAASTSLSANVAATSTNFAGRLAGDVIGVQSATVVSNVGGLSAASVAAGASAANIATSANTASAIIKRDASGNFSAGTITANLAGNSATATVASNFSGSLAGDVTGLQNATVISSVGGQSAANVANGVSAANAATSANTANTIVKRDGSGNFTAEAVTATSFSGDGSGLTGLNGANLVSGSVGPNQLGSGAALANLQASGQLGVAGGGIVLSTQINATNLLNAGYTILGNMLTAENWASGSAINAPSARTSATAVWTGTQVIVWGGLNGTALGTGAAFDPVANSWAPLPTNNAPSPRYAHAAVWTGTEMIIWCGQNGGGLIGQLNTGARYNPVSNLWTTMSTNGAPSPRDELYDAVWTGTEIIVWGGYDPVAADAVATGGRYNPATDTWTTMTTNGAPHASYSHATAWTGTEMLIWGGGYGNTTTLNTGARYNPALDSWTPMSTVNAPASRFIPYYVWTGKELIVWGGRTAGSYASAPNTGARYNPATDTWVTMSTIDAPSARSDYPPRALWTGSEMIIWGGQPGSGVAPPNDGGRYDPAADTWKSTSLLNAPSGRANASLAWTGNSMMVFGGDSASIFGDTSIYTPPRTLYLYLKP